MSVDSCLITFGKPFLLCGAVYTLTEVNMDDATLISYSNFLYVDSPFSLKGHKFAHRQVQLNAKKLNRFTSPLRMNPPSAAFPFKLIYFAE